MSPLEGPPDGSAAPLYSVCRFVQVGVETCGVRWRVTQKSGLGARDPGRVVCQAGPEAPAEELGGQREIRKLFPAGGTRGVNAPPEPRVPRGSVPQGHDQAQPCPGLPSAWLPLTP